MTVSSLSFDESLTVVQYCREMANPNYGFRMQLQRYQENLLLKVSLFVCLLFFYLNDVLAVYLFLDIGEGQDSIQIPPDKLPEG